MKRLCFEVLILKALSVTLQPRENLIQRKQHQNPVVNRIILLSRLTEILDEELPRQGSTLEAIIRQIVHKGWVFLIIIFRDHRQEEKNCMSNLVTIGIIWHKKMIKVTGLLTSIIKIKIRTIRHTQLKTQVDLVASVKWIKLPHLKNILKFKVLFRKDKGMGILKAETSPLSYNTQKLQSKFKIIKSSI